MDIFIICVYQFLTASYVCGRRSDSSDCLERIQTKEQVLCLSICLPEKACSSFSLPILPPPLSLPSPPSSLSPLLPSCSPYLPQPPLSLSAFLHFPPLHLSLSFPFYPLYSSPLKLVSKSGCPCPICLTTFNLRWKPGRLDPLSFSYNQRLCTLVGERDLLTHL